MGNFPSCTQFINKVNEPGHQPKYYGINKIIDLMT